MFIALIDRVGTEFSSSAAGGGGNNNSGNMGELMRDKVLAALALNAEGNESIREVDLSSFATGEWINYTRTYPTGFFNVYLRAAASAAVNATLSTVTGGWGTTVQTSNALGSFSYGSTGESEDYAWVAAYNQWRSPRSRHLWAAPIP